MTSTNPKARVGTRDIVLDEDNVVVQGTIGPRGNLVEFEARKGFPLPILALESQGQGTISGECQSLKS
jgi:hypothetical protein